MDKDDGSSLNPEIRRLLAAKAARRRALAALSFPEKVAIVGKLQEMATPILRARGQMVRPWRMIDSASRGCGEAVSPAE